MSFTTWAAAFDVHGDQQDKSAVRAFFNFVAEFKPKRRYLGGDVWDFRPLRKKADAEERRIETGMAWLW